MKNKLKKNWKYHLKKRAVIFSCLGLVACGGNDFSDLEQKIAEIKARPKTPIEPLPDRKTPEPFLFDPNPPDGARDPFKAVEKEPEPPAEDTAESTIKPDPNRPKEDLEGFALDTLRMVGTIKRDDTLWGLVKTTKGTIYRVKEGNYMGFNDGRIIKVSNDEIKLMEIVPDKEASGKYHEQAAALKMVTE